MYALPLREASILEHVCWHGLYKQAEKLCWHYAYMQVSAKTKRKYHKPNIYKRLPLHLKRPGNAGTASISYQFM